MPEQSSMQMSQPHHSFFKLPSLVLVNDFLPFLGIVELRKPAATSTGLWHVVEKVKLENPKRYFSNRIRGHCNKSSDAKHQILQFFDLTITQLENANFYQNKV